MGSLQGALTDPWLFTSSPAEILRANSWDPLRCISLDPLEEDEWEARFLGLCCLLLLDIWAERAWKGESGALPCRQSSRIFST